MGRDRLRNTAAFFGIALIGGGNPVGVAVAVETLAPFWAGAVRFIAAGLIFGLAMAIWRIPVPHGRALIGSAAYGVLGFFVAFALIFWGLRETPAGTAQVIIALVPLFTLFLAMAHGLERFRSRGLMGMLLAVAGLAFVLADRIQLDVPLASMLAVVVAAVFMAESGVILKLTPRAHPVASNAVGMLVGGLLLLILSATVGEQWTAPAASETWVAMVFLVLGGSVAVFGLYVFLLGRWTATLVSYVLLLQPVSAVVYSAVLRDEPITPALFVGGAVVLMGVYVGAFSAPRPSAPIEEPIQST